MNDTILHLPNGDFVVFRDEDFRNPARRAELLPLMLEPENFDRLYGWWKKYACSFGLNPEKLRNTTTIRNYLRRQCQKLCIPAAH